MVSATLRAFGNSITKKGVRGKTLRVLFRPGIILLGGVCAQGSNLVKPLQKLLDKEIFAGELGPKVKIRIAKLENSAGLLGAAALLM